MDSRHLKLPKNRRQSYFDCVFNKTSTLLLVGLTILLCALPLLIILGVTNILIYDIKLQLLDGLISKEVANSRFFETYNAANFLLIPAFIILFIGLSGIIRVTRRMIFQEHIAFFYDFKAGVKSNARSFVLAGLFLSLLYAVMMLLARFPLITNELKWLDATFAISIAAFVLALLIVPFYLLQSDLYNLNFKDKLKNSFLIGMRSILTTLPFLLLLFAPWLLLLINYDSVVYFIVIALLLLVVMPLSLLAMHEYGLSILDKYINKVHHPSIYRKGLFTNAED